jgi:hypothetical protein
MSKRASRPSVFSELAGLNNGRNPNAETAVELMAQRQEQGLDLWTGEPLTGEDAKEYHWLRNYGQGDEPTLEADNVHNAMLMQP